MHPVRANEKPTRGSTLLGNGGLAAGALTHERAPDTYSARWI